MTTISIELPDGKFQRLAELAASLEQEPALLLQAYVDYLVEGGAPVEDADDIPVRGVMRLAEIGGAFDWLNDEPDLYSLEDGEPYGHAT